LNIFEDIKWKWYKIISINFCMVEIPNMKFLQLEITVLGLMVLNNTMPIWYYTITNLQLPNMYDHVWYDCIWVHVLLPSEVHSLSLFWFLSFFYRHLCFVRVFLLPLTGETNWKAIWLRPGNAQWIGQGCDEGGAAGGVQKRGPPARISMWGIRSRHAQHASSASHFPRFAPPSNSRFSMADSDSISIPKLGSWTPLPLPHFLQDPLAIEAK